MVEGWAFSLNSRFLLAQSVQFSNMVRGLVCRAKPSALNPGARACCGFGGLALKLAVDGQAFLRTLSFPGLVGTKGIEGLGFIGIRV